MNEQRQAAASNIKEALIFELSAPGRRGVRMPALDVPHEPLDRLLPASLLRETPPNLPEVAEVDVVRHFIKLSQMNHAVDTGFYPLGSCTMKYNPKINEDVARLPGFAALHPYQPEEMVQGALKMMYQLEQYLNEVSGMCRTTLQPAAGAHGELAGIMLIRAYHEAHGNDRHKIIVPDSAHGTNPATAAMAGYSIVEVPSNERGGVDLEALKSILDNDVAGLMLTNPNTLGVFDENIREIADLIHGIGGLLYYDGANANAIMGYSRPGDMGFDIVHFNLHKTFATPHGGGGPGSGPISVCEDLEPFLPVPLVEEVDGRYTLDFDRPQTIGQVKAFVGNFGVFLKAYAYCRSMGGAGLKAASADAVLNANYLMHALKGTYHLPFDRTCMHEFVLSGRIQKRNHGVSTLDIAKALLDYGIHPPTVYFPLIVEEALMIEPTETESRETLDQFIEAMLEIARDAEENPEALHEAPMFTPVRRLDEGMAARNPIVRWTPTATNDDE